MASLALLVFNKNETQGVVRLLSSMHDVVDEIVIIDNSDRAGHRDLEMAVESFKPSIHWVLPLGYPEPLGTFALRKIKSECVVWLAPDEEPSEGLTRNLRNLIHLNACLVRIDEPSTSDSFYRIRVFRKESVTFTGSVHDELKVRGTTVKLGAENRIIHSRLRMGHERYYGVEAFEHVLPRLHYGSRLIPGVIRGLLNRASANQGIQDLVAWAMLFARAGASLLPGRLDARITVQYAMACHRYSMKLPPKERLECQLIEKEIRSEGIINYLGFEDSSYVEALSQSFREAGLFNGNRNLYRLVFFRHLHQRRLDISELNLLGNLPPLSYPRGS